MLTVSINSVMAEFCNNKSSHESNSPTVESNSDSFINNICDGLINTENCEDNLSEVDLSKHDTEGGNTEHPDAYFDASASSSAGACFNQSSSSDDKLTSNSISDTSSCSPGEASSDMCKYQQQFPLHWHIWHNNIEELNALLNNRTGDLEQRDPRGRTPLLLAVTLGHLEATKLLLARGCSTQADTEQGWTVVQEAVSCGDPELLSAVLRGRDNERHSSRALGIPHLLQKLAHAPDFYVEMKWEFTSWVPLVSRMCPSDTYRVFKRGSSVRIDTTLLGFHESQWQRGSRSYIFRGQGDSAVMYEVDHDKNVVYREQMQSGGEEGVSDPPDALIAHRLTSPNVSTTIDTDQISFERDKSGIWGWRADKSEIVNGHDCKVFSASNVEIVTRTRSEHLTAADKERTAAQRSPLHSFFAMAEEVQPQPQAPQHKAGEGSQSSCNPSSIAPHEYFDTTFDLGDRDIGRPKEMATKSQKFKAVLWLAEQYPLRLQEQVMPIVDLMAISSTHFAKLQHFIQMQLPSGFPVKIEIPLFHVLTARITFGNIFGLDSGVEGVTSVEDGARLACILDQDIFTPPPHYGLIGGSEPQLGRSLALEEDDALLQFALHQSLVDSGGVGGVATMDVWEALQQEGHPAENVATEANGSNGVGGAVVRRPGPDRAALLYAARSAEQTDLQRAIEESLLLAQSPVTDAPPDVALTGAAPPSAVPASTPSSCSSDGSSERGGTDSSSGSDADLALALALSKRQLEEDEERRRRQEEDMLQQILQLSLSDQ